ncbi:MAG: DUF4824 family protein [Verrucomicrobia bacterium]|nr:DUF4824 family protein [Verrucomicrobiota bacterium]
MGFGCREAATAPRARDYYNSMAPRTVYLVLEFEGQAWQEASRHRRPRTHLYAVDAGPDSRALRERYPDSSRHAIVRAVIRPMFQMRMPEEAHPPTVSMHRRTDALTPRRTDALTHRRTDAPMSRTHQSAPSSRRRVSRSCRSSSRSAGDASRGTLINSPRQTWQLENGSGIWKRSQLLARHFQPNR